MGSPVFAEELSDQEKREFIESLAKPSTEERLFYSWQDYETMKKLLETGEMPPDLQQHYFPGGRGERDLGRFQSGFGFYVAEDMFEWEGGAPSTLSYRFFSRLNNLQCLILMIFFLFKGKNFIGQCTSRIANILIEVKIEPGTKFLDITDEIVREQLAQKRIRLGDVYLLNPKVVVQDFGPKVNSNRVLDYSRNSSWVIKTLKGVKFQPFGESTITTIQQGFDMLHDLHRRSKAERYSHLGGVNIKQSLSNQVVHKMMSLPFNTLQEATDFINIITKRRVLLKHNKLYSKAIEAVVTQAKNLSPKSAQEGLSFLESLNLDKVDYALSPSERAQFKEKLLLLIGSDETLKNSLDELLAKNAEATNSWKPRPRIAAPSPPVKKTRLQCLKDNLSKLFKRKPR